MTRTSGLSGEHFSTILWVVIIHKSNAILVDGRISLVHVSDSNDDSASSFCHNIKPAFENDPYYGVMLTS